MTVYGKELKTGNLISLDQGYCATKQDVMDLIKDTYSSLSKQDRNKYERNFVARQVQKLNKKVADDNTYEQATILEVPKEERFSRFGAAMIKQYENGATLKQLNETYSCGQKKIRDYLVSCGVTIRAGRNRGKKNSN